MTGKLTMLGLAVVSGVAFVALAGESEHSYGWEVVGWRKEVRVPGAKCEYGLYQPIDLRKKVVSTQPGKWWATEVYEVLVNPLCATMRRVPAEE